jgi:hypothetical protein
MVSSLLYMGAEMSYREKGAWIYLVVTIASFGVYVAIILARAGGAPLADVAYVAPMLWTIVISIAATTVVRTAVETARPSDSYKSDVRDKEINRLGEQIGAMVLAIAMAVPFFLAIARARYFWISNSIYLAFVLWAVVSTIVKLVAYRRGL